MESVFVHGKTWYDKDGGTYFSARAFVDGTEVVRLPFQFGYGDQYLNETQKELVRLEFLPDADLWMSLRSQVESVGAVLYRVLEQSRKRDVEGWGKPWVSA